MAGPKPAQAPILDALDKVVADSWQPEWRHPAWKQFIVTGDVKLLSQLPKFTTLSWFLPAEFLPALPEPDQMDDSGKRFLQACCAARNERVIGGWIQQCVSTGGMEKVFGQACELLTTAGCERTFLAGQVAQYVSPLRLANGSVTLAGQFLLDLNAAQLEAMMRSLGAERAAADVTALFAAHAPDRWKTLLETLNRSGDITGLPVCLWHDPLSILPELFLEPSVKAFTLLEGWDYRFTLGARLHEIVPARFADAMQALTIPRLLATDTGIQEAPLLGQSQRAAVWLIRNAGLSALPHLTNYFSAELSSNDWTANSQQAYKSEALVAAVEQFGQDAVPLLEASFATHQPDVQLKAIQLWQKLPSPDKTSIAAKIRELFSLAHSPSVARAARIAGDLYPDLVEDELWSLLAHKSRPVREAAAASLAKLGESRLSKAERLWAVKRADTRVAAVAWLKAIGTAKAAALLKARLEIEDADSVRDAILIALESVAGAAASFSPDELQGRIQKTLTKISSAPVPWLDPTTLPAVTLRDGSKLPAGSLLYLLYRQSRVKEMRADIEARPLYAQIDRKSSGELALAVSRAFFASEASADDRWTMAFSALTGDDRLVPLFTRQIDQWADGVRGKLAEYGVQALALLGTDAALLAIDAIAIRYRSKNKNIGKAASDAFAEAAQARGLTVEELGDLVVPWLGFEQGKPRILDLGSAQLEARVGPDFKLSFRDIATNKKVAKLPDRAPAAIKTEMKDLASGLKEAFKAQLLRMETLMVRQFRWNTARWQELFLEHPLLFPFAQRLVWSVYDDSGAITGAFRTLDDRSLTNAEDEPYTLEESMRVGIAHPLEFTPDALHAWLKHLADYDVMPPIAQLERSIVAVKPEQAHTRMGNDVAGTEINAMTFKGRAERLGWTRASVIDGGSITHYFKSFPSSGIDVFVETDGMFISIDMYSNIKLGKTFFVKHGSVGVGSYTYDEPHNADDPRLMEYGAVPPIAFSEAMGDLMKIAGKSQTPDPKDRGANV